VDIYLIRHTKTANKPGLCYGRTDVPLAGSFAEDICALTSKLPEITEADTRIFSSPLSRCTQLAATFGFPFETDERLLEIDFGLWENRRFEHLDQAQVKHWADNFVTIAPPQGENFNSLCRRAAYFWDELMLLQNVGQVLLITHAGVIRALLAHVLQIPPVNAFKFRVDAGSVHMLQHVNDYTYIHYLNRC
jgi:alpha-ribazole phosphatase